MVWSGGVVVWSLHAKRILEISLVQKHSYTKAQEQDPWAERGTAPGLCGVTDYILGGRREVG